MPAPLPPAIRQIYDRGVVRRDDFEWWLDQKGWHLPLLERGEYGLTIEQAVFVYICEDPVLWAEAFLSEPDTGEPYKLWDYQKTSLRSWDQDVIHKDGAEVGKTREIGILIMWAACTAVGGSIARPWILVGAPQQTHLDEIILEIEEHAGIADGAEASRQSFVAQCWAKPKRTPHTMLRFISPNPFRPDRPSVSRVYFRPAGHDGEAFRGVHVNAFAIMDEAAKIKISKTWDEFMRALKPGCHLRAYSVPDGDNQTRYYKMCQDAVPNLRRGQPGRRLFRWPKTLMPAPFWSDERDREMVLRYGGKESPGYVRNVLGDDGQIENPVWPWHLLEPNVRAVPEYLGLRLHADNRTRTLRVHAYQVDAVPGSRTGRERPLHDADRDLAPYNVQDTERRRDEFRDLLREFIAPGDAGVYWAGGDLGFSKDPTELLIFRELGRELRLILRVSARGVGYDAQCELIYCLDELLNFAPAWGIDFGAAGTAVVQMLQHLEQYARGDYETRLTGFQFAQAVEAVDEDGHVLEQDDPRTGERRTMTLPAKEWATELVTKRYQGMGLIIPPDPELVAHFSNHTSREGTRHRIFSKDNDHTIDAKRVMLLRKVFNESAVADVFASGVYERRSA